MSIFDHCNTSLLNQACMCWPAAVHAWFLRIGLSVCIVLGVFLCVFVCVFVCVCPPPSLLITINGVV